MGANRSGTLDAAGVTELEQLIAAADFEQIKSRPFTGTCPTAYDGQEATYIFHTAQGDQTFATCQIEIDPTSPLFQQIDEMVAEMSQEG